MGGLDVLSKHRRITHEYALIAAVAGLIAPSVAFPHHGVAGYDFAKPIDVEGKVVEARWQNPHVYLTIEARGPNGKTRRIEVEAGGLSQVRTGGLRNDMVPIGTSVTIKAAPRIRKPDANDVFGLSITLADGSTYPLADTPGFARQGVVATGLAGNWVPSSSGPIGEYMQAEGRANAALARAAGEAGRTRDPVAASCADLARAPAPFITAGLAVLRTIEMHANTVVMRIDANGYMLERSIDLSRATHRANVAPTPLGHSIGRWEGSTLVVDTVAFEPNPAFHQGPRKHLVEQLTLTEDRRQIRYEFTVEDPDYYAEPFRYTMLWSHRPDLEPSGATCDEENARRYLSLQ
jgi:hypothetical protein